MRYGHILTLCLCLGVPLYSATFGIVAAPPGGAAYSDIVLDESRSRVYLVNTAASRIDTWNMRTRSYGTSIPVGTQPVSAALARDGRYLYVTAFTDSTLDVIDLNSSQRVARVLLPLNPEGAAVGADGRILISSLAGTTAANTLIVVDAPDADGNISGRYSNVPVLPPASTPPSLPAPPASGRVFIQFHTRLLATPDGRYIVGANGTAAATKDVFVYESASGTVLRSRSVANLSTTLAVAPDASRFMAGATLFDMQTLQVMAQENAANAPFTFPGNTNFNLQQNEGGSAFSPDGSVLYAAFNVAPAGAARPNITQLLINDPDNLLINLGIEMPENLAGKMVIDSAGANIYALSDSGMMLLPISTIANSPLAVPRAQSVLLVNDPCNVLKGTTAGVIVDNAGKGRLTVNVGGPAGGTNPVASVVNSGATPVVNFRYNPAAATNPGTLGPSDFLVTSSEAINNPGIIHVFQNNRDSIAAGDILPIPINAVASEGLTDILLDAVRNRLYIANSGMNRLEVYDTKQKKFLPSIKVGQMPHGMALDVDGVTLYVANSGGESISIVDLAKGVQTGRVTFPALPFNANAPLVTPVAIATSIRGPEVVMSAGTLWKVDDNVAIPRSLNPAIFGTAVTVPGGNPAQWSLAATPGGEYVLLVTGTGNAYLYDVAVDDFTLTRQVLQTAIGYVGAVTAGPLGRYYAVGGAILNSSLSVVQGGATGLSPSNRPVAAVAAISATQLAEFTQPVRASATVPVADAGLIEILDAGTGQSGGTTPTLEGPATLINGLTRTTTFARTMAIDASSSTAYVLTASGLSVVNLNGAPNSSLRPAVSSGGIVNPANFQSGVATGGLMTIIGSNLGSSATATAPLPTLLGGVCVTINNVPIPLLMTAANQITAQIPVTLAAGRYPLVIRSLDNQTFSPASTVTVAKYAPAVFVENGQAAIMHPDGSFVTKDHPAKRDETLTIYATGMGPTHGGTVVTGGAAPASPAAGTDAVSLYFGNPLWKQGGIIVRSSSLLPGMVGITEIKGTVPGFHISGSALPVLVRVGGVSSPTTGSGLPFVAVD